MVTATSITNNTNPVVPMHLNFFDSLANTEIRPSVKWSFTRNLISRELQKLPAYER